MFATPGLKSSKQVRSSAIIFII